MLTKTHNIVNNFIKILLPIFVYSCVTTGAYAQSSFSKLVAFGDSLSDTGNIANITFDFPFPYYENRITDGPVALDYIAQHIGSNANASLHLNGQTGGYNYAVAGGNIVGNDIEDLTAQVTSYLSRVNGNADPNALFVIFIGGNDVRGIRGVTSTQAAYSSIEQMLSVLITQMSRLSSAGAQNFLVSNVANIGRLPESIQRESSDPGVVSRVASYSVRYNKRLLEELTEFVKSTKRVVRHFDVYAVLEEIINDATSLGIVQTTVGCFDFDSFDFHPDCFSIFGIRFERFVFFDNLHPTSLTHQIVGNAMIQQLSQPPLRNSVSTSSVAPFLMLLLDD